MGCLLFFFFASTEASGRPASQQALRVVFERLDIVPLYYRSHCLQALTAILEWVSVSVPAFMTSTPLWLVLDSSIFFLWEWQWVDPCLMVPDE